MLYFDNKSLDPFDKNMLHSPGPGQFEAIEEEDINGEGCYKHSGPNKGEQS